MNYSFIESLPRQYTEIDSFLRDQDFECKEQNTCDSVRWELYYREFKKDSSNTMIRIVLRFELSISDSPIGTYSENHDLCFTDAFLEIWDRQMQSDGVFMGEKVYDEESEDLRLIGEYPLAPSTFSDIQHFSKQLE